MSRPTSFTERPCAAPGLKSYRCRSLYGWIMIGARDDLDALREARRTNQKARPEDLQEWDGQRYVRLDRLGGPRPQPTGRIRQKPS